MSEGMVLGVCGLGGGPGLRPGCGGGSPVICGYTVRIQIQASVTVTVILKMLMSHCKSGLWDLPMHV